MKLLIVDDSMDLMARTRRAIASVLPDIEVSEYDPEQKGSPPDHFEWSIYDAMILAARPDSLDPGLAWLARYRGLPGFPPVLFAMEAPNPTLEAQALGLGAAVCVPRETLPMARTAALIHKLVAGSAGRSRPAGNPVYRRALPALTPRTPDGRPIGYRFVRLIGQGENSRVYLAERLENRSSLVLKIIDITKAAERHVRERFVREAEIIANLGSPSVVTFFDHGFTDDYGYIAMEFFTRGDLKQRIEQGITPEDAVNYLLHIAAGLQAVHEAGIIHRDIKPGNIMFRADDSLVLADFGISRRLDDTNPLTRQGTVLGTPNYLSPEQACGQRVDTRADLYCAGVIFYEMLTGEKPYKAASPAALLYQHVHAPIPRLPAALGNHQPVVDGLLAKRPEERYPSARALIRALTAPQAAT
jgi:serine/threonine-protein kinase PpkA